MKKIIINLFKIIYPVALYFIISFGIALIFRGLRLNIEVKNVIMVLIIEQAFSIAVIYWIYRIQSKAVRLERSRYRVSEYGIKNLILIFTATYFMLSSISLFSVVLRLNETYPGYSEVYEIISGSPVVLQIIAGVILAPVLEELLCRGIIYNRMREISNFYVSALVSSLIWSAAHMNVVQGFTALLYGFFLAFLYEKFKSLWVTIGSHGVFNLIAVASGYIAALPENEQAMTELNLEPAAAAPALIINLFIAAWLMIALHRSKFPRTLKPGS